MDTIYQTQCQSGIHEAQSVQWPPDMSDLILTLGSVPMAQIYCPTIYLFLVDLTENGMHGRQRGFVFSFFLRNWFLFKVDRVCFPQKNSKTPLK